MTWLSGQPQLVENQAVLNWFIFGTGLELAPAPAPVVAPAPVQWKRGVKNVAVWTWPNAAFSMSEVWSEGPG